jgi:hypothetical protein
MPIHFRCQRRQAADAAAATSVFEICCFADFHFRRAPPPSPYAAYAAML